MLGISLDGLSSADVVAQGLKTGVVMLTAKEKVRLLPPLTITYEEMEKGVEALKQALILAKEASK